MNSNIEPALGQDRTLKSSISDGMSHAAMLGCGESYINPFAIFLGGSSFQIGLLTTLPLLIASIIQSFGVWLTENFSSRLKIIVSSATVQAMTWLPIALIPFFPISDSDKVFVLIFLVIIYQTSGSLGNPAWNSLMGDVVPENIRGNFFGYRNKLVGLITFGAMVFGGMILYFFQISNSTSYGYVLLFFCAMLARLISVSFLKQYKDLPYQTEKHHRFSFFQFIIKTPKSNYARFVLFFACMNFSAYIAAPFFSVYLLKDLKVSYFTFTIIIASATVSQFLTMHYWGKLTDRFGNRQIMKLCGVGVAFIPLFWFFASNTLIIIFIQAFAGMSWAGFNLAGANFMFDAVTPPKRTRCVAYQAIVNSTFICLGGLTGALLSSKLSGFDFLSYGLFTPKSIYFKIFTISAFMRLFVLLGLLRLFKEVRKVEKVRNRDLIFGITNLRPVSGIGVGLLASLRTKKSAKKVGK